MTSPLVPLALALTLLAPAEPVPAPAETLRYAPAEGALLRREHHVRHVLTTRALRFRSGEAERVSSQGFDVATRLELLVTDRVDALGQGRPELMRRAFDRARLDVDVRVLPPGSGKPMPIQFDTTGAFEGRSVVFTWVPEEQEYGRYYDAEEGVEEDLPRLLEDLDFRGFLPAGPVEEGATWDVDPRELRHVVGPGGFLGFDLAQAGDILLARALRGGLGTHVHELFGDEVEGRVKATYGGVREVEGRRLGVIALELDVDTRSDLTELARRSRTTAELESGMEVEAALVELELEGQGELLWDLAGGHAASAELAGEERVKALTRLSLPGEGDETVEQELELAGTFASEASVRLDEDPEAGGAGATDRR